ncbi:MAG: multicopper oxidase family protein [Chloroflexia bacterium]|nr:multicopper oxidase family protein [Chloroflexia bacterium]
MAPDSFTARSQPANPRSSTDRARRLNRRRMLGGAVGAAGLAVLSQGSRKVWSAATQSATPVAVPTGASFVDPPVLRGTDGRLDVALEARFGPASMGGQAVTTYNFNGAVPGPVLRLRAGETLGVTLSNQLEEPTNLHTHGLHVSPAGNSDNIFLHIAPGETVAYEYDIPRDGTSGLYIPGFYWYHPHIHGNSAEQVEGGLAGALIVEGELDQLPEIRDLPERLLVLQATQFDETGAVIAFPPMEQIGIFVNGQSQPEMAITPGETQRWRILNASSFMFMNLALDGHQMHQIASDANPLREVWSRDQILLSAGERIEVLIQGGDEGEYAFRSLAWGADLEFQAQPDLPIATLVSTGPPVPTNPLPATLFPFEDLREAAIDRRREITFSEVMSPFEVLIDGRTFDADRVDQTVQLGATEEWRLRNTSPDWHPFHIHVNDFQLVEINGEPFAAHSWEDTTPIPAMGEIVIRTRFLDFPGKFVYHCHILDHEDQGMMGVVEVVAGSVPA